jgi:uncharacterized C2H2 Zn-finger protein
MRQAIIVKNPKWEPFTTVSDAFKAISVKDKDSAVLVVRGRCKEKTAKTMKQLQSGKTAEWLKTQAKDIVDKVKKSAAVIVLLSATSVAFAQQDITTLVGVPTSNPGMSNSAVLVSPPIAAQPGELMSFQATHTGLIGATGTSNIVYSCDVQLANSTYWHTNAFTLSFPCVSSNAVTSIVKVTNSVPGVRVRFNNVTRGEANPFKLVEMHYYVSKL